VLVSKRTLNLTQRNLPTTSFSLYCVMHEVLRQGDVLLFMFISLKWCSVMKTNLLL